MLRFRLMMNARSVLSGLKHQKEKRNMDYFAGLNRTGSNQIGEKPEIHLTVE